MPTAAERYILLGEISADVKHILAKSVEQGELIEKLDKQRLEADKELDRRLSTVEKFQWKLMGIATTIPIVMTAIGLAWTVFPH